MTQSQQGRCLWTRFRPACGRASPPSPPSFSFGPQGLSCVSLRVVGRRWEDLSHGLVEIVRDQGYSQPRKPALEPVSGSGCEGRLRGLCAHSGCDPVCGRRAGAQHAALGRDGQEFLCKGSFLRGEGRKGLGLRLPGPPSTESPRTASAGHALRAPGGHCHLCALTPSGSPHTVRASQAPGARRSPRGGTPTVGPLSAQSTAETIVSVSGSPVGLVTSSTRPAGSPVPGGRDRGALAAGLIPPDTDPGAVTLRPVPTSFYWCPCHHTLTAPSTQALSPPAPHCHPPCPVGPSGPCAGRTHTGGGHCWAPQAPPVPRFRRSRVPPGPSSHSSDFGPSDECSVPRQPDPGGRRGCPVWGPQASSRSFPPALQAVVQRELPQGLDTILATSYS